MRFRAQSTRSLVSRNGIAAGKSGFARTSWRDSSTIAALDSQHLGLSPIRSGALGNGEGYCFFGQPKHGRYEWLPEFDVASACREQMRTICELVEDCYDRFGLEIDPDKIYTPEGLRAKGWTLEDVEEQLGFARGWTNVGDDPDKDNHRLNALRREIAMPTIWPITCKYRDASPAVPVFTSSSLAKTLSEAVGNLANEAPASVMNTRISFIRNVGQATEREDPSSFGK